MSKKTFAPQTNITMAMTNGMTVHSSSSASEPWMPRADLVGDGAGGSLIAKMTTSVAISSVKNAVTATQEEVERVDLRRPCGRLLRKEAESS